MGKAEREMWGTDETFGEFIRRRREYLKLTREDIASAAGLSAKAIESYEYDKREPKLNNLYRILAALQITNLNSVKPPDYQRHLKVVRDFHEGLAAQTAGPSNRRLSGGSKRSSQDANAHLLKLAKLPAEIPQWDSLEAA